MNDQAKACELAKTAFDAGLSDLDKLDDETYKDAQTILQLLKDNLSLWTQNDEEDAGGDGTNVEDVSWLNIITNDIGFEWSSASFMQWRYSDYWERYLFVLN